MDRVIRDVRYALRGLRAAPGFTLTVLLILSLSIGGVTSIFSAINGALLRPPRGIAREDGLVWLTTERKFFDRPAGLSLPDIEDYNNGGARVIQRLGAYDVVPLGLASGGEPQRIQAHLVVKDYFGALGAVAVVGRFFEPQELEPNAGINVVVLSHSLWETRFGADATIDRRSITVNGVSFRVVGVAAPNFSGPDFGAPADVWIPMGAARAAAGGLVSSYARRDRFAFRVFARLRHGVAPLQAQGALGAISQRLANDFRPSHGDVQIHVSQFRNGFTPDVVGETVSIAIIVSAAGVLVLLISCFNIANLMLARAVHRTHECSVRLALGATRAQLARQMLVESLVIGLAGGLGGLLCSFVTVRLLVGLGPEFQSMNVASDPLEFGFAFLVALLTALLFGIGPALHLARRADLAAVLGDQARGSSGGPGRTRLQSAFTIAQLAVSLVLLSGAGQLIGVLERASRTELGFTLDGVSTVSYDPTLSNWNTEQRIAFNDLVIQRLSALPGVAAAALADVVPLSGVVVGDAVALEGAPPDDIRSVSLSSVSPGYFGALQIPFVIGRTFGASDRVGAPEVAIVNETAGRLLWPGRTPIGQRMRFEGREGLVEVVGVVRDAKYDEPIEGPTPYVYLPLSQRSGLPAITAIVRSAGSRVQGSEALKDVLQPLAPTLAFFDAGPLREKVRDRLDRPRAIARLLSLSGFAGLLIAAIGLYGVVSYTVTQRRRELGIRLALGASPRGVHWLVVRRGLFLAGASVGLGLLLAIPLAALLSSTVFGLHGIDVRSFGLSAVVLTLIATAAAYVPARGAARVAPTEAMRDQ